MEVTARFLELLEGPDAAMPLDELALLIAAHAHARLDVAAQLARLDALAEQAGEPTLDGLRRLLFRDLGFTGNDVDYYDPRNSFLDDVLDRRTGIPISLAVVMLEVGRRMGVPLSGVSMPGHFLVRDKVDPEVFVDPFAGGALLDRRGCRIRFHAVHGRDAAFAEAYLAPVGPLAIVDRMLANLEGIAARRADTRMLGWVGRLRDGVPSAEHGARRRAAVLVAAGRFGEAAAVLEAIGDDEALVEARGLRARLN